MEETTWKRGTDENIIKNLEWEGVDWTHPAQDKDQWWTLVNTAMNLQLP